MHIFIHYLFTNTYQCLRPQGVSSSEKLHSEFSTAVRVYALAREYDLPSLEELAKVQMKRLNNELPFSVVLSLVLRAYPGSQRADDLWLGDFFKTNLTSLLQNPSNLRSRPRETKQTTFSASDLLLKCLKELADDEIIFTRGSQTPSKARATQNLTFSIPTLQPVPLQESLAGPYSDTAKPCELGMTESAAQRVSDPECMPAAKYSEQEDPATAPTAEDWGGHASDEERELAALEAKKIRRGKLTLRKDKERYMLLKGRSEQTAEERAAKASDQAAVAVAAAVADTVAEPVLESVEADTQPAVGGDVAGPEAFDEKTFKITMDIEMADLEAKLARKGKLTKKDRVRYEWLKDRADRQIEETTTADAPHIPATGARAEAVPTEGAFAEEVTSLDQPALGSHEVGKEAGGVAEHEPSPQADPGKVLPVGVDEHRAPAALAPDDDREDDWSLCDLDCGLRAEHILRHGWTDCWSCRLFVDRLHKKLTH